MNSMGLVGFYADAWSRLTLAEAEGLAVVPEWTVPAPREHEHDDPDTPAT